MSHIARIFYLLAMYSGVRAAFNRTRSAFLPSPKASILDGQTLQIENISSAKVHVHPRAPAATLPPVRHAGMISINLLSPGIPRFIYGLLRLTSHFGCGHIEIAFYEDSDAVTVYAIRNIIRSNIDRFGGKHVFRSLKLASENDEILILQKTLKALNDLGIETELALPEDCVRFAVNRLLLDASRRDAATEALHRKYSRISKKLRS